MKHVHYGNDRWKCVSYSHVMLSVNDGEMVALWSGHYLESLPKEGVRGGFHKFQTIHM